MPETLHLPNDDFGRCPQCGGYGDMLDVGPEHWVVCHAHKTEWRYGIGIFDDWRGQGYAQKFANDALLKDYKRVKPVNCAFGRGAELTPEEWVRVILNRMRSEVLRDLRDKEPPF